MKEGDGHVEIRYFEKFEFLRDRLLFKYQELKIGIP